MRIIVTGGAGFIGSHIVAAALAEGHEVVALDDLSGGKRENVPEGVTLATVDVRDGAAVDALVRSFRPDAICHQGAQTSVSRSVREPFLDAEVNVLGTLRMLEAARDHGVRRFVFASTGGAIYGEVAEGTRASVAHPLSPLSPYACSKLAGEAYVRAYATQYGFEANVLRYANVYGPRQDPHGEAGVVAIFTQRLLAGEPIQVNARKEPGDAGCVRDYVYVEDVVRMNLRALRGELSEPIVNVCTGVPTDTRTLAERIAAAAGATTEPRNGPRRAGDLERSVLEPPADPALQARVALETGIERTVDWFRRRTPG